jgi:hypothetical protein
MVDFSTVKVPQPMAFIQSRVADGSIGNSHVGIEPGKGATVIDKILAVVGPHNSPVPAVVDVIRLAAVLE